MGLMLNALPRFPKPENSPFVSFAPETPERRALQKELWRLRNLPLDEKPRLPLWINGPVTTKESEYCKIPHCLDKILGFYHPAGEEHVQRAVGTVLDAREKWSQIPWFMRMHIFRRAARLMETKYLIPLVAAVMEDYSKNPFEAFIDVQELIDFLNFNVYYASTIYAEQPDCDKDTSNMLDYRPHEGFIFALPPNNFIAINGNLCTAPLIMGNVVIVKPASDVVYSFHMFLKVLHEAGLPKNVLAVLHGNSGMIGDIVMSHPMLSGVHFTGGTETFNNIWKKIGQGIDNYRAYPKIVGETGGKDAIVVYDDHDPLQTATSMVVGAFGYQGQKCSATSRVYMTWEMFHKMRPHLTDLLARIKVGDVTDFRNFMGAVINRRRLLEIESHIAEADRNLGHDVLMVMRGNDAPHDPNGWFVPPTVIVTANPAYQTMSEEVFGPLLTICLLHEAQFKSGEVLKICDGTSPYALTGAVQTQDMEKFCEALDRLRYSAGNIYDDRTTAAMVDKQPFSGSRKSGTNSKVGWRLNLFNWVDPRTIGLRTTRTTFPPKYLVE